jgi:nucleoside diphosphate kinase
MRLGIIIIVSIATTSCNSIKEESADGTTPTTNEDVSGRNEPKQQNFTYEVTANQRKHVDKIIEGFEALGVITAENKQSCFTLSRIGKYETSENGAKRIQIFMVFDELVQYTILGSTVSPDQHVQVNGDSDRTRIGSSEECLQSTAGTILADTVTEARVNDSVAVVGDSEKMDKNITAFAKHDGDTVGGR